MQVLPLPCQCLRLAPGSFLIFAFESQQDIQRIHRRAHDWTSVRSIIHSMLFYEYGAM